MRRPYLLLAMTLLAAGCQGSASIGPSGADQAATPPSPLAQQVADDLRADEVTPDEAGCLMNPRQAEAIANLLAAPASQPLTLDALENTLEEGGLPEVRLFAGADDTLLVAAARARCSLVTSHAHPGYDFYAADRAGNIWPLDGWASRLYDVHAAPEGWVTFVDVAGMQQGAYEVWHVQQTAGAWQIERLFAFDPADAHPEDDVILEDGRQRVVIHYTLSAGPPPCEFGEEVKRVYTNTVYADGVRVYEWAGDAYEVVSDESEPRVVVNLDGNPDSPFPPGSLENWQDYCVE
jgi:hypothetical protein